MVKLVDGEWGRALLSEYGFLEVVTVMLLRQTLSSAIEVGKILLRAREVDFVSGAELFVEAWKIFREQQRTKLSFADAAILAIAERENAGIATFDRALARVSGRQIIP